MIVFKAHQKAIYGIAFSPDGKSLLTSGNDNTMRLWSLAPVVKIREWPGSPVLAPVAYSPDGRFVARGGFDTSLWPAGVGGKPLICSDMASSVAFSPDGRVFTAHRDAGSGLARWRLPGGKSMAGGWGGTRKSTSARQFPCGGMAYSPDGSILATTFGVLTPGRYVSVVYLWDARRGQSLGALPSKIPADHPADLCFSPDGSLLAGASGHLMRIWDVASRSEIANLQLGRKFFKGQVFEHDGTSLLTVGQDDTVTRWAVRNWSKLEGIDCGIGNLCRIARTTAGTGLRRFAAGGTSGKLAVWDAAN